MTTWLQAHQAANFAAAQAHADLGVDPATFPIDVYAAIAAADVMLMWRPLPRAFGLYLDNPGSRPGILLNNQLEPAVQRHTAGHELGHHLLGHGSRVDVDLDLFETTRRGWTEPEKAAEAFAAWFLMPRRAVLAAMRALGRTDLSRPEEVYQLSLLLGTSYRSTARHLLNLRLCSREQSRSWMAVPPNRLKQRLDPGCAPVSRAPDVWRVDRRLAGATVTVSPGDRLVVDLGDATVDPTGTAGSQVGVVQVTSSTEVIALRAVPPRVASVRTARRATSPTPHPTPWTGSGRYLTVELTPDDPPATDLLDIHVGGVGDPHSWIFHLKIEQTRWGPAQARSTETTTRADEPHPAGGRHTMTITVEDDTLL
jgi:Zn-dependent peptidase ImmA (M78 family)